MVLLGKKVTTHIYTQCTETWLSASPQRWKTKHNKYKKRIKEQLLKTPLLPTMEKISMCTHAHTHTNTLARHCKHSPTNVLAWMCVWICREHAFFSGIFMYSHLHRTYIFIHIKNNIGWKYFPQLILHPALSSDITQTLPVIFLQVELVLWWLVVMPPIRSNINSLIKSCSLMNEGLEQNS